VGVTAKTFLEKSATQKVVLLSTNIFRFHFVLQRFYMIINTTADVFNTKENNAVDLSAITSS